MITQLYNNKSKKYETENAYYLKKHKKKYFFNKNQINILQKGEKREIC